jgi:predicted transcriptional regulator
MSIHPRYASAILSGIKTVEFRKRRLASDVRIVLMYATAPVKKVVGFFEIAEVIEDIPEAVWNEVGEYGGISRAEYEAYYLDSNKAVAFIVRCVYALEQKLPLFDLSPSLVPPQSFSYLSSDTLRCLDHRSSELEYAAPRGPVVDSMEIAREKQTIRTGRRDGLAFSA